MSQNCLYLILSLVGIFVISFIIFFASHIIIGFKLKKIYGNKFITMFNIPTLKEFNSVEYAHLLTFKGFLKLEIMIWKNDLRLKGISKRIISTAYFSMFLFYPLMICVPLLMFLCADI
jgi:hypothetical protein